MRAGYAAGLADAEHAGSSGRKAGDLATGRVTQQNAGDIQSWLHDYPAKLQLFVASLVDQFQALNWQSDITDYRVGIKGRHPTRTGDEKVAATWAEALITASALHKCP